MSGMAMTRRRFHQVGTAAAAAAAVSALSSRQVLGANERIRVGFIGVANRGMQLVDAFQKQADMEIVALCDVSKSTLEKAAARIGGKAELYGDFRKLIDRRDVDAVVIATPDHWHAIQTIAACRAGKDVYVEKPTSVTIREGRRMVEVARQTKRVVQVGLHRRSSALYAETAKFVQAGRLGKVVVSRCYHLSNMYPAGIGKSAPSEPPADLDWDMWLGPRPMRPFQATIAPYKFRWWMPYSSQIANNGTHAIDLIRWITGDDAPRSIVCLGGRYAVDDDRTIPDTMETTFECASGRLLIFGQYEACGNPTLAQPGFIELRGTHGSAYVDDSRAKVVPERGGQFQDHRPRMEPMEIKAPAGGPGGNNKNLDLTAQHARNFLDCIKSRELPHADVEIGHRSTTFSLLANIALVTRSQLEWDATRECFVNNPEADKLLHYEYRKPWTLD